MGETRIEWCDYTFNPWIGCEKVSAGCANCYAEVDTFTRVRRAQGVELWGRDGHRHVTSDANWRKPRLWNERAGLAGETRRVFCASLADVFEEREDLDAPRARLFRMIEDTQNLNWLLLTKRPWGLVNLVPRSWQRQYPRNVWAGTTVENQEQANARIPWLLRAKVSVRFVSYEPALGSVDLRPWLPFTDAAYPHGLLGTGRLEDNLSWIIVGGESGPNARPFDLDWARSAVAQCRDAGVACFVKQLGSRPRWGKFGGDSGTAMEARAAGGITDSKGGDPAEWPEDLRVRKFPKGEL